MFGQTVCPDVKERACLSKDSTYAVACCHYPQETDPNFMAPRREVVTTLLPLHWQRLRKRKPRFWVCQKPTNGCS